jgi:GT2 family glycosyltransferase
MMDTEHPYVSVIVPAYNEAERIGDCIEALLNLDYPSDRYEVIVVNNHSTDHTAAIIDRYPVIRLDERRQGVAYARNAGIRAARGGVLAFIDADCIPGKDWLKELLAGIERQEIGCFAGEFAPQPFRGFIDEYVHDRELIQQKSLLHYHPPVVATGNVAYRKRVFEQIGLFDASFVSGEDSDLAWRMQKSTPYRILYNQKACVFHPHPASLQELLRRCHRIGNGIARFRLKHSEDFPERMLSPVQYGRVLLCTTLGVVKVPCRVITHLKQRVPIQKSVTYPLLDKLLMIAQEVGTLQELLKEKPRRTERLQEEEARFFFDINQTSCLMEEEAHLASTVRDELRAISHHLLEIIPAGTVLLTGSFSVGEGKYSQSDGLPVIESDYDLVVVSPCFWNAWPSFIKKRLDDAIRATRLSTHLEITLIWKPLLRWRFTTTGGVIIAGRRDVSRLLKALPPPQPAKAIQTAYRFLAEAPLNPETYSTLLSKALLRAGQAILLHQYHRSTRKEWSSLSSIHTILSRIEDCTPVIGEEAVAAIVRAGNLLLGTSGLKWGKEDYGLARGVLQCIHTLVFRHSQWQNLVKHTSWLFALKRFGVPRVHADAKVLQGLQALAEAWDGGERLDHAKVREASRQVSWLGLPMQEEDAADPLRTYVRIFTVLSSYVLFYPHKLYYAPNRRAGLPWEMA